MNMKQRWNLHYLAGLGVAISLVVFFIETWGHPVHPALVIASVLLLIAAATDRQKV